ncbi:hypothetical protein C1O66_21855 [Paucibacter aquatile]|uniref:Uncharacterized protein n=1 Tax=Kinneretia aquatilis TaxID=2070761 RepID=A0A2N8KSA4_9BURK|nr:MAG: hypothetical protein CFE41_04150 [Burkholderiales bacterium PBB2]PND36348.1 hypothetical protein C1O66_21855 [Paucibacter aquatile]
MQHCPDPPAQPRALAERQLRDRTTGLSTAARHALHFALSDAAHWDKTSWTIAAPPMVWMMEDA